MRRRFPSSAVDTAADVLDAFAPVTKNEKHLRHVKQTVFTSGEQAYADA